VTYERPEDVDRLTELISNSDAFRRWKGGRMRTGPVTEDDGTIEATWLLFAPDEDVVDVLNEPVE
jgi:hypothetical protein